METNQSRMDDMVERYGEVCTQKVAGQILNVVPRTIHRMMEEGLDAQLLLQVHDELDFSCAADQVEQLSQMVKQIMEQVVELQVPLVVDVQSGPTWAEAH